MDQTSIAQQAAAANNTVRWDQLWTDEGDDTWRAKALQYVYERIVHLFPDNASCCDVGGGRGMLAKLILDAMPLDAPRRVTVVDHSKAALKAAREKGLDTKLMDLLAPVLKLPEADLYVATEVLEHLPATSRHALLAAISKAKGAFISVPNDRLGPGTGPGQEPQHTIAFTAMTLKRELQEHWEHVRIEPMGFFLLAVVGEPAKKGHTMSACLPVRDEAEDLEKTLASIRGIADQLVVGVDPRTTDNTWEVAEKYADLVFELKDPMGPPTDHTKDNCFECMKGKDAANDDPQPCKQYMGEKGIHFAWVRNQCIDKCTGEWIFMTEGHEYLEQGMDVLLRVDEIIPEAATVAFVYRQGNGQRWGYPWLHRNLPSIRYVRPVHNALEYPDKTLAVTLTQVRTMHKRHETRTNARQVQRQAQNRKQLMDDWRTEKNISSLFYLGNEWRGLDDRRAMEHLKVFIHTGNNGVQKYQGRLILAKEYMLNGDHKMAREMLVGCTEEDWSRTEHWIWLGDLAYVDGDFEKAYQFYMYSATTVGEPPFTLWWIDLCFYTYLPCQRLAMVSGELGEISQSLAWARKVAEQLPEDSPQEAFDEAEANIKLLQEAIENGNDGHT